MNKYIFTFGCGQENAGHCQPIFAGSYGAAREKMFELHGEKWAFQYTGEEWEGLKSREDRYFPLETELEPIYAEAPHE
jgi:hypothetical protein